MFSPFSSATHAMLPMSTHNHDDILSSYGKRAHLTILKNLVLYIFGISKKRRIYQFFIFLLRQCSDIEVMVTLRKMLGVRRRSLGLHPAEPASIRTGSAAAVTKFGGPRARCKQSRGSS